MFKRVEITGYEGLYEIDTDGNVFSLDRIMINKNNKQQTFKGKNIKHFSNEQGYKIVSLCKNGISSNFRVHRLVAIAFIENFDKNKIEVNHIDGDKSNNNVSNLEWVTPKENTVHAYKSGLMKDRFKRVNCIDITNGEILKTFNSIKEASQSCGISQTSIWEVCNNYRNKKTARGFYWEYSN